LREFLQIPDSQAVVFERFSDSSGSYVNLDPSNVHAYKTLYRAAKAKLKLRLRAMPGPSPSSDSSQPVHPSPRVSLQSLNAPTILNSASEVTLNTVPGPSTSATIAESQPSQQLPTEVDTKPQSHILTPQVFDEVAKRMECVKRMMDPPNSTPHVVPPSCDSKPIQNEKAISRPESAEASKGDSTTSKKTFVHRGTTFEGLQNGWSVYCNNCEKNMLVEHYHCIVCDGGDYDLCQECMDAGFHCPGDSHWLIKRYWTPEGTIVTSTTQVVSPKLKAEPEKEMPGAFTEEKKAEDLPPPTRTCNCCVKGNSIQQL
jgi:next to BRCA1 gene 1 protein